MAQNGMEPRTPNPAGTRHLIRYSSRRLDAADRGAFRWGVGEELIVPGFSFSVRCVV